ncbi:MAG: pyrrolo-quinoline quinone, partial [Phycisphaerales bacterium]|nr:pyrrolo-quinoline quinone [Phycisphaerales bacterium]
CNPVVVDGAMYAPTVGGHVVAVDAATGVERWRFKPEGRPAHRGLTYFRGRPADAAAAGPAVSSRVMFVAGTGLWCLDPATGRPVASFGDGGRVTVPRSTTAPAVYRNVIVVAGFDRDVFGYDLSTGKPLWTFRTIPKGTDPYADTWDKPSADGANAWGGLTLDAGRGIAYVTTGSPKPNFVGVNHLGDNLFGNCVVAIDATTGVRLWHFQEVRHDIWDLDGAAPPVLVTVTFDGRKVDAVAAVTKIGNTLLLDRVTGKPLFPFRLRRAPASTLPGERTAAYQPAVELPEPFARQQFSLDDVTNISPAARQSVLDKLEPAVFGWFRPFEEGKPLAMYGFHGGADWPGACADPAGVLYVASNELPWLPAVYRNERPPVDETKQTPTAGRAVYATNCLPCLGPSREGVGVAPSLLGVSHRLKDADVLALLHTGRGNMPAAPQLTDANKADLLAYLFDRDRPDVKPTTRPERPAYRDGGYPKLLDAEGYPGCKPPWGLLTALDLNTGKIKWRVPLGEHPELTARGVPKTGTENFGGPSATAGGVVFCSGTRDLKIRAFDAATGAELWSHPLPFGGTAPPTVYAAGGKQYVVVPATGGGKLQLPQGDAYVAFALP